MSYTIYMGSFQKALNSTKQPAAETYTAWASFSCVFKEETSLYTPTLLLAADFSAVAAAHFNYAVMLGRYYWISDIRSVRTGHIEVDLQLDPLATYKDRILDTYGYIEYGFNTFDASAAAYRIPDKRAQVSQTPTVYASSVDPTGGLIDRDYGTYIVQAVGNNPSGGHQGLATFAMSGSQLKNLLASVQTDISGTIQYILGSGATVEEIANMLTGFSLNNELLSESAMSAIQSVQWVPFALHSAGGSVSHVFLGNFDTGALGYMLDTNTIYESNTSISIPWPVSDARRNFCQLVLYLPFFGTVPIQVDQCINAGSLSITWTAEYFSGSISIKVNAGSLTVYTASTSASVPMGVGRSQVGISQLLGGGIQTAGGALELGGGLIDTGSAVIDGLFSDVGAAGQHITSGAMTMLEGYKQMINPAITCAGSMGGMAAIGQSMNATLALLYFTPINDELFNSFYGHPVMKVDKPVAGFCQTRGFSVALNENSAYAGVINAAMDGGVFIE